MISERLKRELARMREHCGCNVFVVMEIAPGDILALIVPHGSEEDEVINPLGVSGRFPAAAGDDWDRVTLPVIVRINEATLPVEVSK